MKVIDSFLAGKIRLHKLIGELEKAIDEWHESTSSNELHDFLGLSWEEYALFVEDPLFFIKVMHQKLFISTPLSNEAREYGLKVAQRIKEQTEEKDDV